MRSDIRWSAIRIWCRNAAESYELELSQEILDGAGRLSATWFDGEFRNAIDFDPGPPPMLVNRNRVDTEGFELAGRVALSEQWQLDASLTQAKSRVASTGNELRNRPEWRGGDRRALDAVRGARAFRRGNLRRLVARFVDRDRRRATAVVHAYRRERGVAGDAEVPGVPRHRQSHG